MVLLTITPAIAAALEKLQNEPNLSSTDKVLSETQLPKSSSKDEQPSSEPCLISASVGNPITHAQILKLSQALKSQNHKSYHLDTLLRGTTVFLSPPPLKPEPTPEYKALMARLRFEAESIAYSRMTSHLPQMETFSQRFPSPFTTSTTLEDDEITLAEVKEQTTLIFNVLLSILACAAALWTAAKWWNTPARLALTMCGSAIVGIAEVVVYAGYLRKVGEATGKEKKIKEMKEVLSTWSVGGEGKERAVVEQVIPPVLKQNDSAGDGRTRRRRKEGT